MARRSVAVTLLLLLGPLAACSSPVEDSPACKAACEGPPLRADTARRAEAEELGYEINRTFDCIDKASFLQVSAQRAAWAAAQAPAALAKREAEYAREAAERRARVAALRAEEERAAATPPTPLVLVDVNTATESELAAVPTVGVSVAAEIVRLRATRSFRDWPDLVGRVVGLSAAQTAVYASICGLTVNGESLAGAPADAAMAASVQARLRR